MLLRTGFQGERRCPVNSNWLCIHKRINHSCPDCHPKVGPLSSDKPDVDLARARAFYKHNLSYCANSPCQACQDLAAEFRAVRLDEAKWWSGRIHTAEWILEFRERIAKLEAK